MYESSHKTERRRRKGRERGAERICEGILENQSNAAGGGTHFAPAAGLVGFGGFMRSSFCQIYRKRGFAPAAFCVVSFPILYSWVGEVAGKMLC